MQIKRLLLSASLLLSCAAYIPLNAYAQEKAASGTARAKSAEELLWGNPKSEALIKEGNVLQAQQKLNEAIAKYQEAANADPQASGPWSNIASVFFSVIKNAKPEKAEEYRLRAKGFAEKALELYSGDPMAQEVLRGLQSPSVQVKLTENEQAAALFDEAESDFQKHDFKNALLKYEAAYQLDPNFSKAILYAGDSHFQLGDFDQAEKLYRRALDLNPRNFQAWRFLAHAQMKQGRPLEMVKLSLIRSVEVQPNYMPAWDWYEMVHDIEGTKLKKINVKRHAQLKSQTKDGASSYNIELSEQANQKEMAGDASAWLMYALMKSNFMTGKKDPLSGKDLDGPYSPYKAEVEAWRVMITLNKDKAKLKSPLLKLLVQAAQDDQLEAAVFVFLFEESYREEFEAWKKAKPLAMQAFVEKYLVRPSYTDK